MQCKAQTSTGQRCRRNAIEGTDSCYLASHGAQHIPLVRRALNFVINEQRLLWVIGAGIGLFSLSPVLLR
jgi:hypothetical protein